MNRKVALLIIFIIFFLASSFFVSSDTGELHIDTDTLEQRENTNGQVTIRLRIDILTAKSAEEQAKAQTAREQRLDNSVSSLFSEETEKKPAYETYIAEMLFQNPKSYFLSGDAQKSSSEISTITIIVAAAAVTAISYVATLIYRKAKRQEN